ncbi:efflux RND transporter periplasmic adaptor subunit [Methylobacterium sp. J-070]|uniref:efflux RND transporter periplasmic adaptor subunit n=1 Tax=Methylobacterium sp. J-070 TaxID=2836650 RepID=UPI001FBA63DC|nr:HlyD family efflux transporter periplasmic adaptor subunit [Methylobacterium sp. J-070]MCJ2050489.1 HlyD family efflux transporter periplasmic adaptor subunit [Methylobacterium sp. J-070]
MTGAGGGRPRGCGTGVSAERRTLRALVLLRCHPVRVGCLLILAAGPAAAQSTPEGTRVLGVRAGSACLTERVRLTGFARPHEESGAGVPFDGYRVTEILVGLGDTVTAGQEILRAARGGQGAASAAPQAPETYAVRAPIAGRITRLDARVGALTAAASAAEPMVGIAADQGIDLIVDVPSLHAPKIKAGTAAQIRRDDGFEARGTVRSPVAEVDPRTQLGRTRISVEPADALRSGQFASATIETARDCGLAVPRSAITYRDGEPTVQVLNGTKVETRGIRTGLAGDEVVRVREGLAEDESVVASAGEALRTGDRVTPVITGKVGDAR